MNKFWLRLNFIITLIVCNTFSLKADYLMIKSELKPKVVGEPLNTDKEVNLDKTIIEKAFYHDNVLVVYHNGNLRYVIDANKGIFQNFVSPYEYIELDIRDKYKSLKKKAEITEFDLAFLLHRGRDIAVNRKKGKIITKVKNKCLMYDLELKGNPNIPLREGCYHEKPPKAFTNFVEKLLSGYGTLSAKKIPKVNLDGNPYLGLEMYHESPMIFQKSKQNSNEMFTPDIQQMVMVKNTVEISTKKFDRDFITIPKDAKRLKTPPPPEDIPPPNPGGKR